MTAIDIEEKRSETELGVEWDVELGVELIIRRCASLDDFRQCVAVQQSVWGFEDKDLVPLRFFVVASKIEGQIFGGFDPSGRMAGFCLAVPALKGSVVYLHSHMLGVLPEFRRLGLGRRLKLEQRREALARGIGLIEWTFDPLELYNAYLNLERLGAVARRYLPNHYGISSSPLHRGLPTDRLVAEWWLDSPQVAARVEGKPGLYSPPERRIAVPIGVGGSGGEESNSAATIQPELRRQFQQAFAEGLVVTGFEFSETAGTYLLGEWTEPRFSGTSTPAFGLEKV